LLRELEKRPRLVRAPGRHRHADAVRRVRVDVTVLHSLFEHRAQQAEDVHDRGARQRLRRVLPLAHVRGHDARPARQLAHPTAHLGARDVG
jgi:hypothetical protein